MGQCSEGVDLVVEQVFFDFALYFAEFEDFDGNGFAVQFVESLVDVGAKPAPDDLGRIVDIIFNLLD